MIKGVIIDDESGARDALKELLSHYCKSVAIVDEAHDVKSGIHCIKLNNPDIVFLDIDMPDGTGFDLLHKLNNYNFNIIFTTAYSDYAIEAFKHSATHYLLKPIIPDELVEAVKKAERELQTKDLEKKVIDLLGAVSNADVRKRLVLSSNNKLTVVYVHEIIMCQSYRNYTTFFMEDGQEILVSKTLKEFDDVLLENGFMRPHRQYMINMLHVRSVDKTEGSNIILTGGHEVPVSTRKREKLLEIIQRI
jgi:two-component system LytT family response regulator